MRRRFRRRLLSCSPSVAIVCDRLADDQAPPFGTGFALDAVAPVAERLGALPILNAIIDRLGLDRLLDRFVPTRGPRCRLPWSKGLGVLLRSILVQREPVYRQHESVSEFAPDAFRLTREEADALADDQIGRSLERLFDADRAGFTTEVVLSASRAFGLTFDEPHNDSTSVRFTGQYRRASGRSVRGRPAPYVCHGFSKDHRPDLRQLLFILTTTADGGVPVQFRCDAGNQSDSRTHEETWEALRKVAADGFLYVADSKLCGGESMDYIDSRKGRFVTVMPRSRSEDQMFREWMQTNEPAWETVRDRLHPRRRSGPRDVWRVFSPKLPSKEGWPITWVFSALLKLRQEESRMARLQRAECCRRSGTARFRCAARLAAGGGAG